MKKVKNILSSILSCITVLFLSGSVFFIFGLVTKISKYTTDKTATIITLIIWAAVVFIIAALFTKKVKTEEAEKIRRSNEAWAKECQARKVHRGTAYDPYQPISSSNN